MFLAPTIRAPCTALMPTPPDADHHHRVPRLDLGAVHRRSPAGRHPAGDQGHDAERQVGVDLHQRGLVAHAVLGEGAQFGHHVEGLAVEVVAHRAVGDLARGERRRAEVTQVGVAGDAHLAPTADREEAGRHMVAQLEAAHVRAHLEDDPSPLVAADHGEQPGPRPLGGARPPSPSRSPGGARRNGTVRPPPTGPAPRGPRADRARSPRSATPAPGPTAPPHASSSSPILGPFPAGSGGARLTARSLVSQYDLNSRGGGA